MRTLLSGFVHRRVSTQYESLHILLTREWKYRVRQNNSHILKVNKNQTKQGTQKILLFIKSTYDAIFSNTFKDNITQVPAVIDDTLLKPFTEVVHGFASFNCSIVPGRRARRPGTTTRSRRHSARDDLQSHGQLP